MTNKIINQAQTFDELRRIAALLLDPRRPAHSLRSEVSEMVALLNGSTPEPEVNIAAGETRTEAGLALSPTMAAMCVDDYVRTIQFIRGTHTAIADLRKRCPDRPTRVLYVGCGPFAILALPSMILLPASEATFSLLDIHSKSIQAARSAVDGAGLADRVERYIENDVLMHQLPTGQPAPDIVLMEIMQACLASEPQVAAMRHLVPQAPEAVFLPEEVSIDLTLADPSGEFDVEGTGTSSRKRIPVGTVFTLSRSSVDSWAHIAANQLPAETIRFPESFEPQLQPMLFTNIRVYGDIVLNDYDSGLTCPKLFQGEPSTGAMAEFHYELGRFPGLHCSPSVA